MSAMALKVKLIKSLNNCIKNQVATANSLGLRKIGDVSVQPDSDVTKGKIRKISHLVEVSEA
jgi:large subunit ribosomal protein L30